MSNSDQRVANSRYFKFMSWWLSRFRGRCVVDIQSNPHKMIPVHCTQFWCMPHPGRCTSDKRSLQKCSILSHLSETRHMHLQLHAKGSNTRTYFVDIYSIEFSQFRRSRWSCDRLHKRSSEACSQQSSKARETWNYWALLCRISGHKIKHTLPYALWVVTKFWLMSKMFRPILLTQKVNWMC